MFDLPEEDITKAKKWKFIVTDHLNKKFVTIINSPQFTPYIKKKIFVFDCYLEKPENVQELLKNSQFSPLELKKFLHSKEKSHEEN